MKRLSIVIPCYNAENNIRNVIEKDEDIFEAYGIDDYEFVLVNDGSKDNTWNAISNLSKINEHVVAINLARNFGQHNAIMAGFHHVSGDYIVVSDDDGQTQMSAIGSMIQMLDDGYDVVMTNWEKKSKREWYRRLGTKINDKVSNKLLNNPNGVPLSIFFAAKRFVTDEMIRYNNPYPFVTGLVVRTTHNIGVLNVEQLDRKSGQSGYSFKKLLGLWMNGFTAFSIFPLRLATYIGVGSAILGFIYGIIVIIKKIIEPGIVMGWSSTVAIIMFMSGVILCVLGMIGEYVGRIYMCINNSPQFIIKEISNGQ